jgi:1,4-alpha-glucan branching enzyme
LSVRSERQSLASPISMYEVHLGSWKRDVDTGDFVEYADLAQQLAEYCLAMGYTHLRVVAHHRTPARHIVGLSDHRLLRP